MHVPQPDHTGGGRPPSRCGISHGHLRLQLPELCLFVVFLDRRRLVPDWRHIVSTRVLSAFRRVGVLLSPLAAAGSRWMASDTGTVPVLSICSSRASCCICSSSSSRSASSMASPIWLLVMAETISSLSAFCSRSLSLFSHGRQPRGSRPSGTGFSEVRTLSRRPSPASACRGSASWPLPRAPWRRASRG